MITESTPPSRLPSVVPPLPLRVPVKLPERLPLPIVIDPMLPAPFHAAATAPAPLSEPMMLLPPRPAPKTALEATLTMAEPLMLSAEVLSRASIPELTLIVPLQTRPLAKPKVVVPPAVLPAPLAALLILSVPEPATALPSCGPRFAKPAVVRSAESVAAGLTWIGLAKVWVVVLFVFWRISVPAATFVGPV